MLNKAEELDRRELVRQAARLVIEEAREAQARSWAGVISNAVGMNPLASAAAWHGA